MQQPKFWYGADGRDAAPVLQALLRPVSWLYAAAGAWKLAHGKPFRAGAPVLCVGNLTVGGAGKTPVTRTLRRLLRNRGIEAHTLSRGYGGALEGPVRVDPLRHCAGDVGDEPLLHARDGPAWIARKRALGASCAASDGAPLIIMDDGFQNPSVHKDISLLVFDTASGVGNGRVFPAGPLREPVEAGLERADAVVLIGHPTRRPDWLAKFSGSVVGAQLAPTAAPPDGPLLAFAGIGRPQKFFDTLVEVGGSLADGAAFPDHHPYRQGDLEALAQRADVLGARLITTEKDHVRLPAVWRDRIAVLPVEARFDDDAAIEALLERALAKHG